MICLMMNLNIGYNIKKVKLMFLNKYIIIEIDIYRNVIYNMKEKFKKP
jgi:hypothetical protein